MSKDLSITDFLVFMTTAGSFFIFIIVVLASISSDKPNIDRLRKAYSGIDFDDDKAN